MERRNQMFMIRYFAKIRPLILLILVQALQANLTHPKNNPKQKAPALFAFGDSIMDPGNNNQIPTIVKCNFLPYGRDFIQQKPTGRFSNGRIPTDMAATALGIKELLPAYLNPDLQPSDLQTGVSFASGSSGYDPVTCSLTSTLTLDKQLDLFRECKAKLENITGPERSKTIISDSFYILISGTNDMMINYYGAVPVRKNEFDIASYIKFLVGLASKYLLELHKEGAKQIAVAGLPPFGCLPLIRSVKGGLNRECEKDYNQVAVLFNSELQSEVQRLNETHIGLGVIYIDIYNILLEFVNHPHKYGFEVADKGCCATGTFETIFLCNQLGKTCMNASTYAFWDSVHPTERAYQLLVDNIFANIPLKEWLDCR